MPEWYTAGFMPPETQSSSFERDMAGLDLNRRSEQAEHAAPHLEHWEVLSGGDHLPECRDTVSVYSCRTLQHLLKAPRGSSIGACSTTNQNGSPCSNLHRA